MSDAADVMQNKINLAIDNASEVAEGIISNLSNKLQGVNDADDAMKLAQTEFDQALSGASELVSSVSSKLSERNSVDDAVKLVESEVNTVADDVTDAITDVTGLIDGLF